MPTMREHISDLIRAHPDADYWEKLVLRLAEALLADVDEQLRGIPTEEAGIEPMTYDDYTNLPTGPIEFFDGVIKPKRWSLNEEGRRRLGFGSVSEELDLVMSKSAPEVKAEYEHRRAALRSRPFLPSQVPFPSGPTEE